MNKKFLSLFLAVAGSIGIAEGAELKECKKEQDKMSGCVEKKYHHDAYGRYLGEEIPYKNGKIEGIWKEYYGDESLKAEIPYKNGKIEGIWKKYYENGNPKEKIPYENGKEEGIAEHYYANRKLQKKIPYENGKKEGVEKHYYGSGKLSIEVPYKNDRIKGVVKSYHEKGYSLALLDYRNNKAISGKCSNGKDFSSVHLREINSVSDISDVDKDRMRNTIKDICERKHEPSLVG